jgi:hypothetical protein
VPDLGQDLRRRGALQANRWRHNVKHPNLVRLVDGEILLFFTAWDSEAERNIFLRRSGDEGESWTDPVQVSDPGWYCTNHGRALTLSTGRVLLPAHGIVGGGPYRGGRVDAVLVGVVLR